MANFVDEAQIHVKAGDGGAGAVAFRREAHVARGGPDGGDGGSGGDVILEATDRVVSLLGFRDHPHRRADSGTHGSGQRRHGRSGTELIVPVPEGTVVRTLDGEVIADLAAPGDRLIAARGGRGGHGNARFLSNKLRAPSFAEQGEVGEERWYDLELKLVADVALVGFPNVGKSTLISRISAAKPAIADYPFTTLEPHLGVVRVGSIRDMTEYVVADIPGLIEGASTGRGLGHRFLRHVERTRVLLVMLDLAADQPLTPNEQLSILLFELGAYRPELLERPRVVIGSRSDLKSDDATSDPSDYGGELEISAATGKGLTEISELLARLVVSARAEHAARTTDPVVHRPREEGVSIVREKDAFVVLGAEAARAVALSDLHDPDALALAHRRLKRIGVDRALHRAGAREGDTVRIGDISFDFSESA